LHKEKEEASSVTYRRKERAIRTPGNRCRATEHPMAEYPPDVRNEIKVLEGDTFFISDDAGNVSQPGPYGLFSSDTRGGMSYHWPFRSAAVPYTGG
jgi:hypothetical protein